MTKDEALEGLRRALTENTTEKYGVDRVELHVDADEVLVEYLLGLGGEAAEVAKAYAELRMTEGFWYE